MLEERTTEKVFQQMLQVLMLKFYFPFKNNFYKKPALLNDNHYYAVTQT